MAGWSSLPSYVANLEKHRGAGAYSRLIAESFPLMPQMARMSRTLFDNLLSGRALRAAA